MSAIFVRVRINNKVLTYAFREIGQGLEELCTASMAAVERCVRGCGGVEMESLLHSLEDGFVTYFEAAANSVEQCRPEDPAVGYALLALANECTTQFNMTNAATRKEQKIRGASATWLNSWKKVGK